MSMANADGKRDALHCFFVYTFTLTGMNSTGGTIQIDYGYLNREGKQESTEFFTRQLYLPVLITVYQNLEPLNWDILYLRHNSPIGKDAMGAATKRLQFLDAGYDENAEQAAEDMLLITRQYGDDQDKVDYCLVTLDVRNTWTVPFAVNFVVDNSDDKNENKIQCTVTINPGSTKRYGFLIAVRDQTLIRH